MINGEFKSIPLADIIQPSCWNYKEILGVPAPDLSTISFLRLPVVKEHETATKKYDLLCGHNQLKKLQQSSAEVDTIPCFVLARNSSNEQILHILLEYNLLSGTVSPIEKALFLKLCSHYLSPATISDTILPLLAEKPQQYILHKYLALTSLDPKLQKAIHQGRLAPKVAHQLIQIPEKDRLSLYELFSFLELGGGKQQRLFSLLQDLANQQHSSIDAILSQKEIVEIIDHPEMNIPQKGNSLLEMLQRQLFPESKLAEKKFRQRVADMGLPTNCAVDHSPFFEKDEVTLSLKFSTIEQLEKQLEKIKKIVSCN